MHSTTLKDSPMDCTTDQMEIKSRMVAWFRSYANRIDSKQIELNSIPPNVVNDLGANGFFAMGVRKEYGGLELPLQDILEILELIAARDIAVSIMILDSLLSAHTLSDCADESIKQSYLPGIASGKILSSVGITETEAGSNPRAMTSRATKDEDGNWILNGSKRWVGYASWAGFINVYAQTTVDGAEKGISGFFVPIDTPGLTIKEEVNTMGMRGFPKHTVCFNDVKIPSHHILGPIGKGMDAAQRTFMHIRLCMGAICLGGIKKSIQISTQYAFQRNIASGKLIENPTTRVAVTELIRTSETLELLIGNVAILQDNGIDVPEPAFIVAKTFGGEMLSKATDRAIQLLGARGYEESNAVAQMYRDGRPFRIFEGPTETLINYLGTQAYYEDGEVYQLISDTFQNKPVADQLRSQVSQFISDFERLSSDEFESQKTWVYSAIGALAQWAVLVSAASYNATEERHCIVNWVKLKLTEAELGMLGQLNRYRLTMCSGSIRKTVSDYNTTLGHAFLSSDLERGKIDPLVGAPLPGESPSNIEVVDWNQVMDPPCQSLLYLLLNAFDKHSDSTALESEERKYTYKELNRITNHLSSQLKHRGIEAGSLVGIVSDGSPEAIINMIAILRLGAGYVPLDLNLPANRIDYMVREANLSIVLTNGESAEKPISALQNLVQSDLLMTEKTAIDLDDQLEMPKDIYSDSTAYVIFTSGSTGTPKGVMISHQHVANFSISSANKYALCEDDRALQFASTSFDASVEEIFPTLITGGTVISKSSSMLDTYDDFLDACEMKKITILNLPTAFWSGLVNSITLNHAQEFCGSLKTVIIGGEKLHPKDLEKWFSFNLPVDLWDTYGPTEATVVSTSKCYAPNDHSLLEAGNTRLTIGTPDDYVTAYVVDENLRQVRPGITGELMLGGSNLGKYLNRPDLNAEKFIGNPFIIKDDLRNSRLYRTGDLVQRTTSGELIFIGRNDDQTKIRGHRIELGEVQQLIESHPNVERAVVLVDDRNHYKELISAIICRDDYVGHKEELHRYMQHSIPGYMIPSQFISIDHFPYTIGGKIDRRAVLDQVTKKNHIKTSGQDVDLKAQLLILWQDILGTNLDSSTNFFTVGGHSLTVMVVIGKIRKIFNVAITSREFFKHPTIDELSLIIDQKINEDHKNANTVLPDSSMADDPGGPVFFPLSPPQIQYYIHDQMFPNAPLYNESILLKIQPTVKKKELSKALNELISRQQMLRSSFHQSENGIFQKIHELGEANIKHYNFKHLDHASVESEMKKKCTDHLRKPFNLETPSQLRFINFQTPDGQYVFIVMHHLLMDGVSMESVFLPELFQLISGNNDDSNVVRETPAYAKYAMMNRELSIENIKYWESIITHHSSSGIPADFQLYQPTANGSEVIHEFSINAIQRIAQEVGTSHFVILTSAVNLLLKQLTENQSVTTGAIFNQTPDEFSQTIGVYSNVLLLQNQLTDTMTLREVVQEVQETYLDAVDHIIPYEEVMKLGTKNGIRDLFDVAILYQPLASNNQTFEYDSGFVHNGTAKFKVFIKFLALRNGNIRITIEYNTDLFKKKTMETMAMRIEENCILMGQDLNASIASIDIGTKNELFKISGEQAAYESVSCIKLFEKQVDKSAENIAIRFNNKALNYTEFNDLINQIAAHLQQNGCEPNSQLGLYMPRSIEQIAAMLAILKLGAVFVPLDPGYPKARLEYIIANSQITHLILDEHLNDLESGPVNKIDLSVHLDTIRNIKANNTDVKIDLDDPAYITYTSGTTGNPKGARVSHRTMSNLLQWQLRRSHLNNVTLQYTPLSFDVSFQEIFSTLISGGTLVLIEDHVRKDPVSLINYLSKHQVTRLFLPFVALKQMADAVDIGLARVPAHLSEIITAGEQLKITTAIRSFFKDIPDASLDNQYGPCETHVVTAEKLAAHEAEEWDHLPSIGKPIDNIELRIDSFDTGSQTSDVEGELWIEVLGNARGYIGMPDENTWKYCQINGKTFYRSGDLVKLNETGVIHWMGRVDRQVKINGFRVELGEIESMLMNDPQINQACVTGISNNDQMILVAYVQLDEKRCKTLFDIKALKTEIKEKLRSDLPAHMIPAYIEIVDAFELTPSGKINITTLPEIDFAKGHETGLVNSNHAGVVRTPNRLMEDEIVDVFARVLNLDKRKILPHQSFYELGGSSLNGFLLTSKLSKHFSIKIDPFILMKSSTPHDLASTISQSSLTGISSLVSVSTSGNRPPIVMVPGSGGTLEPFEALIDVLPKDRPIYGFVHPKLRGNNVDCSSIEKLAVYYVECLIQEVKNDLYYIAGHCFGGAVGYEMCRILEERGIRAIPIIIDTPIPQDETRELPALTWSYGKWVAIIGEILSQNAGQSIALKEKIAELDKHEALLALKHALVQAGLYAQDSEVKHLELIVNMLRELDLSFMQYVPYKSNQPIYLFRAREMTALDVLGILASGSAHPLWGWQDVSDEILCEHISGDHNTMLDAPNVTEMLPLILDCFQTHDHKVRPDKLNQVCESFQ